MAVIFLLSQQLWGHLVGRGGRALNCTALHNENLSLPKRHSNTTQKYWQSSYLSLIPYQSLKCINSTSYSTQPAHPLHPHSIPTLTRMTAGTSKVIILSLYSPVAKRLSTILHTTTCNISKPTNCHSLP